MLAIPLEFSILASGETAGSNVSCRKFLGPLENLLCVTCGGGWGERQRPEGAKEGFPQEQGLRLRGPSEPGPCRGEGVLGPS